jgi:uncharacterized membrane protein
MVRMITVVLGLCGAVVYGFADFLGGLGARRIRAVVVSAVAAGIGIVPLLIGLVLLGGRFSSTAVLWGLVAGVAGSIGVLLLYAALAVGPMSVLSPVTAVFSAVVPVLVGVFRGIALSPLAIVALVAAVVAVVLVAAVRDGSGARLTGRGLAAAVVAGCGFGGLILAYDATPADSGVAPLVVARVFEALALGIAAVVSGMTIRRRRIAAAATTMTAASTTTTGSRPTVAPSRSRAWGVRLWIIVVLCGVFDASANVFIQAALHSSDDPTRLPIVSVLNALYPIGTIVLAGVVLRERLTRVQAAGIVLAVAASVGLALA